MRTVITTLALMLLAASCTTRQAEPYSSDTDTPSSGSVGTRPPDETPVSDTVKTLASTVRISHHYEDFHHTFIIRSAAATELPDCEVVYGIGHDRASFPYNQFSFGAAQLGEYYYESTEGDTLVVTLRAPFWFLYSRVTGHADYDKKIACEDAYEAGDYSVLMMYEEEGTRFYHPFPAALVNGRSVFDLSTPAIGWEHFAHSK